MLSSWKVLRIGSFVGLFIGVLANPARSEDRLPLGAYLQIVESKPVQVRQAEFVAVTQRTWPNVHVRLSRGEPIEIQLRISDRGSGALLFPLERTFAPILTDGEGNRVQNISFCDEHISRKPVSISPGGTYCICREARFVRSPDNKTVNFEYQDGTGVFVLFRSIRPGKYRLSFSYQYEEKQAQALSDKLGGIPVWSGKATTREVAFEVVEAFEK